MVTKQRDKQAIIKDIKDTKDVHVGVGPPCPNCGSGSFKVTRIYFVNTERCFRDMECRSCGFQFSNEFPLIGDNGKRRYIYDPQLDKVTLVPLSRWVWESCHGQKVPEGHVIVHINHNNADDRPCNLVALKSKNKKDQLITALLGRVRDLEYEEVNRVIKESHDR